MKTLLGKFLLATRLSEMPVRVRGGINRGLRWTLFPLSSYWRGTHEIDLQEVITRVGDLKGKCCWDLGAHFGFYSLAMASRVGPTGQVAAFEPNPTAFAKLSRHRALNRFEHLLLFPAAVSDEAGQAELLNYSTPESTTGHLAYTNENTDLVPHRTSIKTVVLDELVAAGKIRLPDLIKIDVEGHGHKALQGALQSIRKTRPLILMGVHCPEETQAVEELLLPLGYTVEDENGNIRQDLSGLCDVVLRPTTPPIT
jgi:FkbM family methyltransferase